MQDVHALFQQFCGIDTADVAVPHRLLRVNPNERNASVINQMAAEVLNQVHSAHGTIPPPQLQWMTQQVINARNTMLVQCGSQFQSPPSIPPVPPPVPQGHQYQHQHHSPAYQAPVAEPPIVVRTAVRRSGNASGAETALGVFGIIAMLVAAGFLGFLFRDQLFGSTKSLVPPRPPSPVVVPLVVSKGGGAGETVPGQAPGLPPARPRPAPPGRPGDAQSHLKNAVSNLRKGFFDEADLDAQKALAAAPGLDEAEAMRLTVAYVRQYTGLAEDARKSLNGNDVVDLGPKWGTGAFIEQDEKSVTFRVRGKNKRFTLAELDAIPGARFRITAAFLDNAAIAVNDLILGAYQFVRQLDAEGIVVRRGNEISSRWLKASVSQDQTTAEQARLLLRLAELKIHE